MVLTPARMLRLDDALGAREKLSRRERLARGRGVGKDEGVEVVDGFGDARAGAARSRAARRRRGLPGRRGSAGLGLRRLPRGPPRLGEGADQARDEREDGQPGQRDRRAVAAHELRGAVAPACRAGRRSARARGSGGGRRASAVDRGVALRRVLLERLGDDRVEVALERRRRPSGVVARARGVPRCAVGRVGGPRRLGLDDGLEQERRRGERRRRPGGGRRGARRAARPARRRRWRS